MIQPTSGTDYGSIFNHIAGTSEAAQSTSNAQSSGMKQTLELMMSTGSGDPILDAQAMKMMIALYILQMLLDPGGQHQQSSPETLLGALTRDEIKISASMTTAQVTQSSHTQCLSQAYQGGSGQTGTVNTLAE